MAQEGTLPPPSNAPVYSTKVKSEKKKKPPSLNVHVTFQDSHLAVLWKGPGITPHALTHYLPYLFSADTETTPLTLHCIYHVGKACSGYLVVSKSLEMKKTLTAMLNRGEINARYRALCHGRVATHEDSINVALDSSIEESSIITACELIKYSPSTSAGTLSTLDIVTSQPAGNAPLRRYFFKTSNPIAGQSSHTKPLKSNKNKGLCLSLIEIWFHHPVTNEEIRIKGEEPAKFEGIRTREAHFFGKKREEDERILEEYYQREGLDKQGIEERGEIEERMPVAYRIGEQYFFRHPFIVSPATIIPRPSTETLVQATLDNFTVESSIKILDLGTGSGCILLSILASLPLSFGVGVDISPDALSIAEKNRQRLHLEDRSKFLLADFTRLSHEEGLLSEGPFDAIVCNPPYLSPQQRSRLDLASVYEPELGLFTNSRDGLEYYKAIHNGLMCTSLLKKGGLLALECAKGAMDAVKAVFENWKHEGVVKDGQGFERCLVLRAP
ncbi:uncharacterized protein VTP21DRAFT_5741 [Calcarisporiella thermophila]|uniref:uncharacterized protein n=1 Tax=Calcarisporiella thermophila TaxID=911321 RepID=UPI0037446FBF